MIGFFRVNWSKKKRWERDDNKMKEKKSRKRKKIE